MNNIDVFTTSDVAKICRVSTRIVTKWFDGGDLIGYRLPGSKHRRFTYYQIREFMDTNAMPVGWLDAAVVAKTCKPKRRKTNTTPNIILDTPLVESFAQN